MSKVQAKTTESLRKKCTAKKSFPSKEEEGNNQVPPQQAQKAGKFSLMNKNVVTEFRYTKYQTRRTFHLKNEKKMTGVFHKKGVRGQHSLKNKNGTSELWHKKLQIVVSICMRNIRRLTDLRHNTELHIFFRLSNSKRRRHCCIVKEDLERVNLCRPYRKKEVHPEQGLRQQCRTKIHSILLPWGRMPETYTAKQSTVIEKCSRQGDHQGLNY